MAFQKVTRLGDVWTGWPEGTGGIRWCRLTDSSEKWVLATLCYFFIERRTQGL